MVSDKFINLLIIHQSEEEAERILSLLRNYQIAVRPLRCTDEDTLVQILEEKPLDLVVCQLMQQDLPLQTTIDKVKSSGLDLPVIALLDQLDNDNISESLEHGADNYCSPSLAEHMAKVIDKERNFLNTRRRNRQIRVELKDAEKRCSSLLDSSKQAIAYIHDGIHVYANQSYQDLFKYDDFEELEVTPFLNMVDKKDVAEAKTILKDIGKNILPDEDLLFNLKDADGESFEANINITPATVDGERCAQFVIQMPSSNPEAEKELFEIKNKDLHTKFYNRAYFENHLSDAIDRVKSQQSRGDCLLYLHIDNTKALEKQLGKSGLDQMIVNLAEFIKSRFGDKVFYARYDEETLVIQLKTTIEKAEIAAKKLQEVINDEIFSAGDTSANCTVSIAVTQLAEQTESVNEVLKTLDQEVQKAIEKGGNTISVFDPAEEEKMARAAAQVWIDKITQGLEQNNFVLHYQPIVDVGDGQKEHFEALIRLRSGEDLIQPRQFIPVAMKHGFIKEIDRVVIGNAIAAIKAESRDISILIKISSASLTDPTLVNWLADTVRNAGISADKIIIEVTESELVTHAKQMKPIINAIHGIGIPFVVEKFGSGLNSFSILKHFPVDYLKVDASFMKDFATNEESQNNVKDIIEKAHALGKQVICEFVEDANSMSKLWTYSVNYVQGNFIAPATDSLTPVE